MSEYNGWTNYATWRIKLELFDDSSQYADQEVDADGLKEIAEEFIQGDKKADDLCLSYALAFLSDVNWYEIAESINKDNEEERKFEEENQ